MRRAQALGGSNPSASVQLTRFGPSPSVGGDSSLDSTVRMPRADDFSQLPRGDLDRAGLDGARPLPERDVEMLAVRPFVLKFTSAPRRNCDSCEGDNSACSSIVMPCLPSSLRTSAANSSAVRAPLMCLNRPGFFGDRFT